MKAEIVSVGTELLLGDTIDSNAATLGKVLASCGISCTHRQTVGDNLDRCREAIQLALSRADMVVTIGGLGPTQDDLTRDAIAAAFGVEMVLDESVLAGIKQLFADRKLRWVESNARQAMRPAFCQPIPNANGSAPGLFGEHNGKLVAALPGPPSEFGPMAQDWLYKKLVSRSNTVLVSRTLRIAGLGESRVEEMVQEFLTSTNPTVAPYAKSYEVHLRVTASATSEDEALRLVEPVEKGLRQILGPAVYGIDSQSLESVLLSTLSTRNETLAVAESVTGGMLASRLASVPGASASFKGGLVAYQPGIKQDVLHVDSKELAKHGAVSEEVALEMATQARELFGSTYALATTGNAGPTTDSGSEEVGRVYVAVAGPGGSHASTALLGKNRQAVRERCAQLALLSLKQFMP